MLRELFPPGDPAAQSRKRAIQGWTRLALGHARALDATPGATMGRAAVGAELRATLQEIAELVGTGDVFDQLLRDLEGVSDAAPDVGPGAESTHPA